MSHEHQLHDAELSRRLKAVAARQRAPRSWVREANAVPRRLDPASEPWLVTYLPHLCGVALLLSLGIAFWFNGDAISLGLTALVPSLGDGDGALGAGTDTWAFLIGLPILALALLSGLSAMPRWVDRTR